MSTGSTDKFTGRRLGVRVGGSGGPCTPLKRETYLFDPGPAHSMNSLGPLWCSTDASLTGLGAGHRANSKSATLGIVTLQPRQQPQQQQQ